MKRSKTTPNECPRYDIKTPDGEAPFIAIAPRSIEVACDRVLSIAQIELFDI